LLNLLTDAPLFFSIGFDGTADLKLTAGSASLWKLEQYGRHGPRLQEHLMRQ
jgi:hypothetical protein